MESVDPSRELLCKFGTEEFAALAQLWARSLLSLQRLSAESVRASERTELRCAQRLVEIARKVR